MGQKLPLAILLRRVTDSVTSASRVEPCGVADRVRSEQADVFDAIPPHGSRRFRQGGRVTPDSVLVAIGLPDPDEQDPEVLSG